MSPSKDGDAPKIAIKFGASKSTISTKQSGAKPKAASFLGKRPRSSFAHDNDSDGDERPRNFEAVTGFGEEGAVNEKEDRKEKAPLVIARQANKDWKGEARRRAGKNLLPEEERRRRDGEQKELVVESQEEVQWGLRVRKREASDTISEAADVGAIEPMQEEKKPFKEKTLDEQATDALMGILPEHIGADLVIAPVPNLTELPESEQDAYRRAVDEAPDVSTLEDYERVPVEQFGAALLRGMGWDGKERKSGRKEVVRRQNLLGLGAKELKGAEELGAWVQKSDTTRLRPGAGGDKRGGGTGRDGRKGVGDYRREREERERRRTGYDERDERTDDYRQRNRGGRRDDRRDERNSDRRDRDRGSDCRDDRERKRLR